MIELVPDDEWETWDKAHKALPLAEAAILGHAELVGGQVLHFAKSETVTLLVDPGVL